MATIRILDRLPSLYATWLPPFFRRKIPVEDLCTCEDCAMCPAPSERRLPFLNHFRPDAKCCTYHPYLPNFVVGCLLADRHAELDEARRRVRALLRQGTGAAPHGLVAPPAYDRRYDRLSDRAFGRLRSLLCPFFDKTRSNCVLWRFRNAVCATYHCKPAAGVHGAAFWTAVLRYLARMEDRLSAYALLSLGWPAGQVAVFSLVRGVRMSKSISPSVADGNTRQPNPRDLWCAWGGNKEALYLAAWRRIARLTPRQAAKVAGGEAATALAEVGRAWRRVHDYRLPRDLRLNPELQTHECEERLYVVVSGHSPYAMQGEVWRLLRAFDGGANWQSVCRRLRGETGIWLTTGFLLALYRAGILLDAAERNERRLVGEQ